MKLSSDDRNRVCVLSSLLRIADALDREHLQKISDIVVEQAGEGKALLRIRGQGDLLLERWALQKKAHYFGELFGLEVRYEMEGDDT
jgi:exopolyphosphatase/guanosine-5'-triphosphate,3'-diphosphate pyrophosphatase